MAETKNDIIVAVRADDAKKVRKLIKAGVDPDTTVDNNGKTILILAAELGHFDVVKALVENGADINRRDEKEDLSPVFAALWEKHHEVALYLINRKADVLTPKKGGKTSLMYAVHSNFADIVEMLIKKGVDVNAANDVGLTALMYGDEDDSKPDAVRMLLKYGANINQRNSIGKTTLMRAVNLGSLEAARLLLESGADPTLVPDEGWDLRSLAESAADNEDEMTELVEEYMADCGGRYYGYGLRLDCPKCSKPVLVNGPVKKHKCHSCGKKIRYGSDPWRNMLEHSSGLGGEVSILTSDGFTYEYRNRRPACAICESLLETDSVETGTDGVVVCGNCGRSCSTFPPPKWLIAAAGSGPIPEQLFGADKEGAEEELPGTSEPVAAACISCGARLDFDEHTPRTVRCDHCSTSQYLPDDLWFTLHPVRTVRTWYIRFS